MMGGGGLVIGLLVLVLLLLVIGGGIAAVVWFMGQGSQGTGQRSVPSPQREDEALAILRQRYARGEIDREEFERMREELRS